MPENESKKVEGWRVQVLIEPGYPLVLAERLAASEIDLHEAVELLEHGCSRDLAYRILI